MNDVAGSIVTEQRLRQIMVAHRLRVVGQLPTGAIRYEGLMDDTKMYFDITRRGRTNTFIIKYTVPPCGCGEK